MVSIKNMDKEGKISYGKRPLWQWILIYAVAGVVIYLTFYYFVFSAPANTPNTSTTTSQATSSSSVSGEEQVSLTANGFSPSVLTVKAGTKVTWSNLSENTATVNSDPHPTHTNYPSLNLGSFPKGGTLSFIFNKTGTYGYHDHLSPGQTGTVIVQ